MPLINKEPKRMGNIVVTEFVDSVGTDEVTFTFLNSTEHDTIQLYNISPKELVVTVGAQVQNVPAYQVVKISETYSSFKIKALSGVGGFRATCSYEDSDEEDEVILGDRINQLTTSLAQLPTQSYITEKAKQTDLDALKTQVNNIPNGSPKGVYATLTTLQSAYPTGTTGVFLVSADGKWYYWNGSAWTAGGIYQATGIGDGTLTPEKTTFISVAKTTNLYNKNATDSVFGSYLNPGNGTTPADSRFNVSPLIPIVNGKTYTYPAYQGFFGSNAKNLALYDSNGNYIGFAVGTLSTDNLYNTVTINNASAVFAKVTVPVSGGFTPFKADYMFVEGTTYPSTYSAYFDTIYRLGNNIKFNLSIDNLPDGFVTPIKTSFLQHEVSVNLYDVLSANNVNGNYLNGNGGTTDANSGMSISHLIPIQNGKSYTFPVYIGFFETTTVKNIAMYDSNGNYIGYVVGTLSADNLYLTITINSSSAAFVKVTVSMSTGYTPMKSAFMFVEGTTYPSSYVSFLNKYTLPKSYLSTDTMSGINPLYGKIAIYDGDSICHGTSVGSTDSTYGWGWAGRIGIKNNMSWTNYGISGGTITAEMYTYTINPNGLYVKINGLLIPYDSNNPNHVGLTRYDKGTARHWVSRNVANMRTDADYIIFEGGTNDVDLIGVNNLGTISTGYTAALDDTTFCGALESTFKQAIQKYQGKKIGYIVAHKMGNPPNANRETCFNLAIQICKKWGIPYIDLWHGHYLNAALDSNDGTQMYTDGQHLTSKGYDAITPTIEAWMKTL